MARSEHKDERKKEEGKEEGRERKGGEKRGRKKMREKKWGTKKKRCSTGNRTHDFPHGRSKL